MSAANNNVGWVELWLCRVRKTKLRTYRYQVTNRYLQRSRLFAAIAAERALIGSARSRGVIYGHFEATVKLH